ncbi:HDOD domain-containing protein [methane-oxidizing endosymbiont of Gigantopelta aegis]|uniref:HDOD domain-containing protein n=1 Tax=methane-oxidizing endosymbiont of Gigantopelta aegis TaxID=2794938 RepID=UPI0018DC295D|nr:HDOD domain-containing protein [methane-oxidizing endosymbiont of Gigantopelta aegis]
MKLTLEKLFDQIHKVPQIPEVVRELIAQVNNPDFDFMAVAKNVEKEQVIALKVLRLVNSAHFGLSRKIGSIDEAVVLLGMGQLKTLVIASGIVSSVSDIPGINIKEFWADSFLTATYAKWLAEQAGLENSETVYTAGLLSGLGTILIHLADPKAANEIDQHVKAGESRPEFERKRIGFTSEEACAALCERWKFAPELVDTVRQSGEPLAYDPVLPEACCVYLGRFITQAKRHGLSQDEMMANFPLDVWKKLGFSEEQLSEKLTELLTLESGLDGLAD